MIFNIAIDIFVKAQKSRDSMPLPAPRGTESGFKLSSLSSQWPKARRVRGGGRQAGRHGDCKGSPLSRHVVSQRLPFGLESTALSACVCVCVSLPGGKDTRGCEGGRDNCCLSGINKCRNRQFGPLAALFQHRCLSYMHQIQLNSTRGWVRQRCCKRNVFGAWIGFLCYTCRGTTSVSMCVHLLMTYTWLTEQLGQFLGSS